MTEIRILLMKIVSALTRTERFFPNNLQLNGLWVHDAFRWMEYLWGRKYGIQHETSALHDNGYTVYQFHSFEAVLTHVEEMVRGLVPKLVPVKIWVPVYSLPGGLPMPASPYLFAIAYDTSTANAGGTSGSFSYTVTGSNPILFVHTNGDFASTASGQTATYNSVSMTKMLSQNTNSAGTQYGQCTFGLPACATGSNTLAYNSGGADPVRLMVSSFSGAKQTSQPDASAQTKSSGSGNTGNTQSVTVVASNCWIVYGVYNNGGTIAVTSGATKRQNPVSRTDGWWGDTNGTVSTGSNSATCTWASSSNWGTQAVSFSPVPPSGPTTIKTLNGQTSATIKTRNGIAWADIKTINGQS